MNKSTRTAKAGWIAATGEGLWMGWGEGSAGEAPSATVGDAEGSGVVVAVADGNWPAGEAEAVPPAEHAVRPNRIRRHSRLITLSNGLLMAALRWLAPLGTTEWTTYGAGYHPSASMRTRLLLASTLLLLGGCSPLCGSASPATPSPRAVTSPVPKPLVVDPSCGAESVSHSLNSNTSTSFNLVNHTTVTLTLFWLGFQGQRVKYQVVPAGQTRRQATFVTHPWVVADPTGRCIDLFLVPTSTHIDITIG